MNPGTLNKVIKVGSRVLMVHLSSILRSVNFVDDVYVTDSIDVKKKKKSCRCCRIVEIILLGFFSIASHLRRIDANISSVIFRQLNSCSTLQTFQNRFFCLKNFLDPLDNFLFSNMWIRKLRVVSCELRVAS